MLLIQFSSLFRLLINIFGVPNMRLSTTQKAILNCPFNKSIRRNAINFYNLSATKTHWFENNRRARSARRLQSQQQTNVCVHRTMIHPVCTVNTAIIATDAYSFVLNAARFISCGWLVTQAKHSKNITPL